MSEDSQIILHLPPDLMQFVRRKVASGEYASVDELVEAALQRSRQREDEFEQWLVEVAGPIYDRMKADPSRGIPAEDVLRRFEERASVEKKIA